MPSQAYGKFVAISISARAMMRRACLLAFAALAVAQDAADSKAPGRRKKRSGKDWGSIDFEKMEKEWESNDEADELKTEHQFFEEAINRRKEAANGGASGIDLEAMRGMDAASIKAKLAHTQADTGAAMIFITLAPLQVDGSEWDLDAENKQAGLLSALLKTGGINLNAYRIDPRRLLVSTMTGWYGQDIVDFLLTQACVMKVTWDSVDYENADVEQVDIPDFKPAAAPKKRRKKKKKKKATSDL